MNGHGIPLPCACLLYTSTQRYVNRDPRMGFSIITHRTPWIKGEIIENGQVLYDAKNYTLTRCHFRKWVEETDLEMEDMPQDVYTCLLYTSIPAR